ncbi:bacteriophage T4 gp5 trimerisation domain-containing protein [Pseudomonas aeruginosa]|uniref:bacteriophage T4 gp5 trimerisation domain-containing protein n=1 Tax=Pseudomonas aeruginosa TaxID=287 RepID=UPI0038621764
MPVPQGTSGALRTAGAQDPQRLQEPQQPGGGGYNELRIEDRKGQEQIFVHAQRAERKVEVRASDHLTVANDQHLKIASGQFVEAGQEIHLSSGLKVVLEAGAELTLKGGGSFLKLDASGVTLSGANVRVNSGGSPGNGSGAAPLLPGPPLDADAATAGQVLDNPARSRPERKGPEQLIVDVWGDPAQGSQVVLLPPESEA